MEGNIFFLGTAYTVVLYSTDGDGSLKSPPPSSTKPSATLASPSTHTSFGIGVRPNEKRAKELPSSPSLFDGTQWPNSRPPPPSVSPQTTSPPRSPILTAGSPCDRPNTFARQGGEEEEEEKPPSGFFPHGERRQKEGGRRRKEEDKHCRSLPKINSAASLPSSHIV